MAKTTTIVSRGGDAGLFCLLPLPSRSMANTVADVYRKKYSVVKIVPETGGFVIMYGYKKTKDSLKGALK